MRFPIFFRSNALVFLLVATLIGCTNFPFRGYLPYQWGKVITPLTSEELIAFNKSFDQNNKQPVMLTNSEADRVFSKLRGPARNAFVRNSLKKTVWLYIDKVGFHFYRFGSDSEGYSLVGFLKNGQFYALEGGPGFPSWFE